MKLLHIINDLGKGGAEKLLVLTLPIYRQSGLDVEILLLGGANSVPAYEQELRDKQIELHHLRAANIYSLSTVKLLKKFLAGKDYDLVHVHLFPAMYWVPLAAGVMKKKATLIFTEHNTHNRRWGKFYFKPFDHFFYRKYTRIIAITDEVKQGLIQWVPAAGDRIVVIKNGIDLERINAVEPADKKQLLSLLDIRDTNPVLLLMAARFDAQKNQDGLIRALKHLPANVHLLLAGEGLLKEKCEKLVKELGLAPRVHFLGFRTDVISLMKVIDINVLSTNFEGLSGVTLEALASGKPFLGAKVAGVEKTVPDNRFLFENNNGTELATKVLSITGNPELADQMCNDALAFVRGFDIRKMAAAHLDLYRRLHLS